MFQNLVDLVKENQQIEGFKKTEMGGWGLEFNNCV